MSEEKGASIRIGYDYRFGVVQIQPITEEGKQIGVFQLRVADILRNMRIPPHELAHYVKDADGPELPFEDIELIRRRTVELCNVAGKVVLDVGGYMGEFAMIAKERGAARSIVLDNEQWRHYGWPDETGPAREKGVEFVQGSLTDYVVLAANNWKDPTWLGSPEFNAGERLVSYFDPARRDRSFPGPSLPRPDVIILYNILYHLKNPWAYLDKCRELIADDGEMAVCTLFRYHLGRWCYWYEERECNPTDETVYNGPSLETLELWFRRTGWTYERIGLNFDRVCYLLKPIPGWRRTHEDD